MTNARSRSVHDRLLNLARVQGETFNRLLTRYAMERFLYRLSISPVRDRFCLKGAMLFNIWFKMPHRSTRDIDLLGFGENDPDALTLAMQSVCDAACSDDGMRFDAASVAVDQIRETATYGGLRVKLSGYLGDARCPIQVDVGYGDAVTPAPLASEYPVLLEEMPSPRLATYPRITVMAEKLESMVSIGMANSRMKDYFDLMVMRHEDDTETHDLAAAIAATFRRRGTLIPKGVPMGLSQTFATDPLKQKQWKAFLHKNALEGPQLDMVVAEIRDYFEEAMGMASML